IDVKDFNASKPFMWTPDFFGLMSFPTTCGNSRYFGLSARNMGLTTLIELDLYNRTVIGEACNMPLDILDAASITETGIDNKANITGLQINKSCQSSTGTVK